MPTATDAGAPPLEGPGLLDQDAVVNPVTKLLTWWRGSTDPETLPSEAENQRLEADRQTIRISQNTVAKQGGSSLASAPTSDVLDPGSDHSPDSR